MRAQLGDDLLERRRERHLQVARPRNLDLALDDDPAGPRRHHEHAVGEEHGFAEIVGDEAITAVTTPETWGEAMTALIQEVKAGRPGDGIVAAVGLIGTVLAEHFPKTSEDSNEIPDKLIEL